MRGYSSTGEERQIDFSPVAPNCCQHCGGSSSAPPYYSVPGDNRTDDPSVKIDFYSKGELERNQDVSPPQASPQADSQPFQDVRDKSASAQPFPVTEYQPKPPRGLNIVIQVVGTAVDVEPFLALGWVLKHKYNHRVRFATHPSFRSLTEGIGLEFFAIAGNPERLKAFMIKKPELLSTITAWNDIEVKECTKDIYSIMQGCWRSCYEVGDGTVERPPDEMLRPQSDQSAFKPFVADVIIANPPSFAHIHCAQKMGVPVHIISTPIHGSLHALTNTVPGAIGELFSDAVSYTTLEMLNWRWLSNTINKFRRKALNLEAIRFASRPKVFNTLSEVRPIMGDFGNNPCTDSTAECAANTFHEQMQMELAKCSLDASQVAVWRVKSTQILLSALSAVALLESGMLKIKNLTLLRQKEHNLEEGPFGPVAGTVAAVMGMVGDMTQGFMDFPREIVRAADERPRSGHSLPPATVITPLMREYYSTSSGYHASYLTPQRPPPVQQGSRPQNSVPRRILQGTLGATVGTSKGVGRIIAAGVKSPFEVTLGAARGFHNVPKLYGDPTVRDVYRISGFTSGIEAAGKEFGLSMYDGFSGLVKQPMDGQRKDGAVGLVRGIGWGLGGLIFKPVAGVIGVVGYTFEGMNQEIQKLFGSRAETHMAASRLAQGCDELTHARAEERAAILENWHARKGRKN